jgi:hypothetical protein
MVIHNLNFIRRVSITLGALFHLVGIQFIDSVKLLFILGFLLSSMAMFLFLRSFLDDVSASLGAMLYTWSPVKATQVYVRGSLSEFFSFVFFPLLFWASMHYIKTGKTKYLLYNSLFTGLLLITHNLMSFIFFPILGVWIVCWLYIDKKWKLIPQFFLSFLLGLGLAAFFTIPVLAERSNVHLESLVGGYFDYRQHFVTIQELFFSNHFGYGSSMLGPDDDLSLSAGILQNFLGLVAIITAAFFYKKQKTIFLLSLVLGLLTLGVSFLMHERSSFIWSLIPPLLWLQFPWRFLTDSLFLVSTLGAMGLFLLRQWLQKRIFYFTAVIIFGLLIILNGSFLSTQRVVQHLRS